MDSAAIDRTTVQELADLARLALPADQLALAAERLQRVLQAFAALRQIDTAGVVASPYPLPLTLPLRPDVPEPVLTQEQVLANAPEAAAGAFLVPRVVEG